MKYIGKHLIALLLAHSPNVFLRSICFPLNNGVKISNSLRSILFIGPVRIHKAVRMTNNQNAICSNILLCFLQSCHEHLFEKQSWGKFIMEDNLHVSSFSSSFSHVLRLIRGKYISSCFVQLAYLMLNI